MKKTLMCLSFFAVSTVTFGKTVDINTAQKVAYNFYASKANLQSITDLSLAFTSTSIVNGVTVTGFYIFNNTTMPGFVIVSADDNVMPILGYSTESDFTTGRISPSFKYLLSNYQDQVAYAIQSKTIPAEQITDKWSALKITGEPMRAARTTLVSVAPLLTTKWDQEKPSVAPPYTYNADCPYDAAAATPGQTLTGCVATAMAQVMKHWNWPDTGVGTHSYTQTPNPDFLPAQTANFAIPFHFDSMPTPSISAPNAYIAKLMYCAGVSVDMNYGTDAEDGSGAYVTSAMSPVTNCAEYALNNYFRYPAATGYQRKNFTQAAWVDSMLSEMGSGRPVIYAGNGPQGGHCWVMDGFDNDSFFHFNWGWSGYYNGYFTVNNLTPDNDTFNKHQEAIIRISADTPVHVIDTVAHTAVATVTSAANNVRIFPNPASNMLNVSFEGLHVTEIRIADIEGRELQQWNNVNTLSTTALPVNDLADGIYLLKLQTDQGIITRKFIVTR